MHKVLFFILFLLLHVNAQEAFKETRYIYAIDKEVHYEGSISFFEKSVVINYTQPKDESIVYDEDDTIAEKRYFFLILNAIYKSDETILNEFFQVKKDTKITLLSPKDLLSEFIKKVEFKKQDKTLEFLKIQMQSGDWILIETQR